MSNENLRVAVARLAGICLDGITVHSFSKRRGEYIPQDLDVAVPDYTVDLNAIHAACQQQIKKKGSIWMIKFNRELWNVLGHHDHVEHESIHATARQRSLAFVKTMEEG